MNLQTSSTDCNITLSKSVIIFIRYIKAAYPVQKYYILVIKQEKVPKKPIKLLTFAKNCCVSQTRDKLPIITRFHTYGQLANSFSETKQKQKHGNQPYKMVLETQDLIEKN